MKLAALALCALLTQSALAAPPPTVAGLWRWKTVVAAGPGKLRGVVGRYTAIISVAGERVSVAVAKEGFGKTDYAADAVPVGVVQGLSVVTDDDGTRTLDVEVRLQGGKTDQRILFNLRFDGDAVSGYWRYAPGDTTYGALLGTRATGQSPALTLNTPLPCVTCCDVMYHCGEQGPTGCNSSNQCRDACEEEHTAPRACLLEEP